MNTPHAVIDDDAVSVLDPGWTPLHFFNLYRAVISGLFVVLMVWDSAPRPLGIVDQELFLSVALMYFLFSIACGFSVRMRWPAFRTQVLVQVFVDILTITTMMHASGGVTSGMGLLLVVAIAGGSLLTEGRIAILFAAMATLAVLAQQIVAWMDDPVQEAEYYQAAMLGAAFFATAALGFVLARRVRASEALAARREVDLANLAQLNEHIIQRMQSGIMALDEAGRVRFVNASAQRLLGLGGRTLDGELRDVLPALAALVESWRDDGSRSSHMFKAEHSQLRLVISFAAIGEAAADGLLVFVEDATAMTQRAQQLKLASLGSLTASIAHEIRNPLGAISHAGQLLAEAPDLGEAEQRLTRIIRDNSTRVNGIIENILRLSRRRQAEAEYLPLAPWLQRFCAEFPVLSGASSGGVLSIKVEPAGLSVRVDPSQLHQVLSNLCENAVRHGGVDSRIRLEAGISSESQRPFLDVSDDGPGVPQEAVEKIFEPFFTTRQDGTGLGLYIARELCEGNQASLSLVPSTSGCRFRITFSDPRRQEVPYG